MSEPYNFDNRVNEMTNVRADPMGGRRKDMIHTIKTVKLVFVLSGVLLFTGCVSGRKVRSAEKMRTANPMRNVAILGGGRVFYPRQMGGVSLCSTQTDRALKALLAQATTLFQMRGYCVVLSEPAGIGFFDSSHRKYWAYSDLEGNSPKVLHGTADPVYVYPYVKTRPDLEQALRNLYGGLNKAIASSRAESFVPDVADLAVVRKYTGADTVALLRLHGLEYTTERKVGTYMSQLALTGVGAAMGVIVVPGTEPLKESTEAIVVCMEVATGEVLWQSGMRMKTVPAKPDAELMVELLEALPRAGYALDPKYAGSP